MRALTTVIEELKSITKKVSLATTVSESKLVVLQVISNAQSMIPAALQEIDNIAKENKSLPWLGRTEDAKIDGYALEFAASLSTVQTILSDCLELFGAARTDEDVQFVVDDSKKKLSIEAQNVKLCDEMYKKNIDTLIENTAGERLIAARKKSVTFIPDLKLLKNGPSWKNVCTVAQQLGGVIQKGSTHQIKIVFPGSTRPITLSQTVGEDVIAAEFIQELKNSLPKEKIPTKQFLKLAFRNGDVLRAA